MKEIWKPVAGYEQFYHVSNLGNVKRLSRDRYAGNGKTQVLKENVWPGFVNTQGYPTVVMPDRKKITVHRMVCEAFHGPPPEGKRIVAHFDGCKTNNRAENLRWVSDEENKQDSIRLGEIVRGEAHGRARFTADDVRRIRQLSKDGRTLRDIGEEYGIGHGHVWNIVTRTTWKSVA